MLDKLAQAAWKDRSHPSRVRGLKCMKSARNSIAACVAPFTGAWIEIKMIPKNIVLRFDVAPFTGAWIEIVVHRQMGGPKRVAPFTGAWIEISLAAALLSVLLCRTLHGCVD